MKRALLGFLLVAAGCSTSVRGYSGRGEPTCRAACDHYTTCAGIPDEDVFRACVIECYEIFYEKGEANKKGLRRFQNLRCSAAVAFVEGSGGPPGREDKRKARGEKK